MGIIGYDAEKYFPESIDIIPLHSIPQKDRNRPSIQIKNFPMIDKNVLFMHSFAAMKELIAIFEATDNLVKQLNQSNIEQNQIIQEIQKRFQRENEELSKELAILTQLENDLIVKELELNEHLAREDHIRNLATLEEEKKMFAYQEKLLNDRIAKEEELRQKRLSESLEFERDLSLKRELLRRETEEKLLLQKNLFEKEFEQQKTQLEEEKIRAEFMARGELERKNEDVTIRRLTLQSNLDTKRFVEGFELVSAQLTLFFRDLMTRPSDLLVLIGLLLLAVLLYHFMKELSIFIRQTLQNSLGRPLLIRETSYSSLPFAISFSSLISFLSMKWIWNLFSRNQLSDKQLISKAFEGVILSTEDYDRVIQMTYATYNTKRLGTSYRHVLLYGPPGTGKTLIARRLAESSGMDYAIMSGGDIGPLGEDAVNQLHSLFRWASKSKKGLLLFIDESEAFLGARDRNQTNENIHVRNALNALLYQTGTHSTTFMLVLATNRPEELDPAILDRIDISLLIGLPSMRERKALFKLYLQSIVSKTEKSSNWFSSSRTKCTIDEKCLSEENLTTMAQKSEGFSGREISKLAIAAEYEILLSESKQLTLELVNRVLEAKRVEHVEKTRYLKEK